MVDHSAVAGSPVTSTGALLKTQATKLLQQPHAYGNGQAAMIADPEQVPVELSEVPYDGPLRRYRIYQEPAASSDRVQRARTGSIMTIPPRLTLWSPAAGRSSRVARLSMEHDRRPITK